MLQRGFGEKRGKDHHVWVYRKSQAPKRTSTRLFGVEKYFYGPEGSDADTNITNFEQLTQGEIQDIRKLPDGAKIDTEFSANLIAHLEMRSEFLRKEASGKVVDMTNRMVDNLKSPKNLRKLYINYLKEHPDELEKALAQSFIPTDQRAAMKELAFLLVSSMPDDEILESMSGALGQMSELTTKLPEAIAAGQNKTLTLGAVNEWRSENHRKLKYSVFRPDAGTFILPDTTLAFAKDGGAAPFSQNGDVIHAVILPISAEVAIIGRDSDSKKYPLKTINRMLAGCSFEAFLAKEQSSVLGGLAGRIGKHAKMISERDLRKIPLDLA